MPKSKKRLHLESIEHSTDGFDCGVSSAVKKDGEHIYVANGEELPYEDGFRISVGQETLPGKIRSTFNHISQERWDSIFGKDK